ncbi:MAG: MmcQ/YjbR family DNA-binding protein [Duncaniella sp.]|uniref:MmcQ/YjbR family DNA-binding protein n=1 Tax=Duncaniella sp. TaxID=2518496 RepID=UPI0023D20616|nr:MmcQ/YjbR family DNA-binding protein [Duncaniella sp.]MDE5988247.1 MmcQ/YjbR family DNA-binding protein [Duncaniella sp.]
MTDIETIRQYCLSLPLTGEDMAFGEEYLLFRVCNKIFACYSFERDNYLSLKCNPDYALDLRDRHPEEIEPAWHWNKKYWNQLRLNGPLSEDFIKSLIRHSYSEVIRKLPKRLIAANPDMAAYLEQ